MLFMLLLLLPALLLSGGEKKVELSRFEAWRCCDGGRRAGFGSWNCARDIVSDRADTQS
jgi:hypothetical protein